MSTTTSTTDKKKKSVGSSLSADAAEFVPLFGASSQTNSKASPTCDPAREPLVGSSTDPKWKGGGNPVEINEVPSYLTSCYPFVSHEALVRPNLSRFPQPFQYSGSLAVSAPRPIRFPQWQGVRPGFIGYPTSSFRQLPGTSPLPIDVTKVTGDGLLQTPPQLGLGIPGKGLLLTPQPDPMTPWLLSAAPPVYVPHPTQQYLPQQQLLLSTATTSTCSSTSTTSTTSAAPVRTSQTKLVTGNHDKHTGGVRAPSPIFISRSSQTNFPPKIRNLTLQETPGPKVVVKSNHRRSINVPNSKPGDQDSDSGYNSPMHQPNNITIGTQVCPENIASDDIKGSAPEALSKENIAKQGSGSSCKHEGEKESGVESGLCDSAGNRLMGDNSVSGSHIECKRKKRQKKDQRDRTRSPKLLGANTKLLSRSSSSLSSSGTKPDDDDEKIDLHSWTDFPPMSARGATSPAASKSPQTLNLDKRVPLTIERSAHEPPWSIKFSTLDESKSERCRSASLDKDKSACAQTVVEADKSAGDRAKSVASSGQVLSAAPDSAWSCIGRSFKSSQRAGQDQERPALTPVPEVTPAGGTESGHGTTKQGKDNFGHFKYLDSAGRREKSEGTPQGSKTDGNSPAAKTKNSTLSTASTFVLSSVSTPNSSSTNFKSATALGTNLRTHYEPGKQPNLVSGAQKAGGQAGVQTSPDPRATNGVAQTWPSSITPTTQNKGVSVQHATPSSVNIPLPSHPAVRSYANIAQVTANPSSGIFPGGLQTPATRGTTSQNIGTHSSYQNGSLPYGVPPYSIAAGPGFAFFPGHLSQPPPPLPYGTAPPLAANFPAPQMPFGNFQTVNHSIAATSPCNNPLPPGNLPCQVNNLPQGAHRSGDVHMTASAASNHPTDRDLAQPCQTKAGESEEDEKKKRRRRRRRTRSKRMDSEGSLAAETPLSGSNVSESTLHFEDIDEFPDLLPASRGFGDDPGNVGERATLSGISVTYSDIIKSTFSKAGTQSRTQSLTGSCVSGENEDDDGSYLTSNTNESKRARKRRKRREHANKAAEAELAEISLEQQWLKEVGLKKSGNQAPLSGKPVGGIITDAAVVSEAKRLAGVKPGGKKSQQPIAFDIAAMIEAIQKKPPTATAPMPTNKHGPAAAAVSLKGGKKSAGASGNVSSLPGNMLDSSAPVQKRGKEREVGKAKKPSPLKKVILKEREQKKRLRLLDEDPATGLDSVGGASGVGIVGGESELSQDALSSKSDCTEGGEESGAAELSADLSPISQTSPISMSPASPGNSGVNSPVTGSLGRDPVVMKIHSRRFREYCTQILDKEIDQCCTSLLQDLVKFQDRMYHKDPVKAKTKRRIVLGLREVTKHLKLKKIKCVVISPNLEKIQSKGGLDEALNNILNMCQEQTVPFVFALGRRALGRACAKLVPVSVVGIFNYEGCEPKYHSLISLTDAARAAYDEMVLAVEKEVAEYPTMASQTSSIGGVPGLFAAHMGHSRTPSGCSAISFTSSILSEPISENFPHAEPEVDSKGYEIVRDAAGNVVHPSRPVSRGGGANLSAGVSASNVGGAGNDFDDGNEADIEDFGETRRKKRGGRNLNSVRFGDMAGVESDTDGCARGKEDLDRPRGEGQDNGGLDGSNSGGQLSRNVSESTLTNDDLGSKRALHKLGDSFDEACQFEDESEDGSKWSSVGHIDSIHSDTYNLGQEILSQHTVLPQDQRSKGQGQSGQLSPPSLSAVCGSEARRVGMGVHHGDGEDDDEGDVGVDDYEAEGDDDVGRGDEEVDEEAAKPHHRIIDKERIKNWLESQTNITTED